MAWWVIYINFDGKYNEGQKFRRNTPFVIIRYICAIFVFMCNFFETVIYLSFQLYDHHPHIVTIAYTTKLQFDVEYGPVDNVTIFSVRGQLFSPAFYVAYAPKHLLGHWEFTIADHYDKDIVLVKFKS